MCYDETINYYDSRNTIVVIELEVRILISSDVIRGYNDTIILFLLMDQPSYGYQVSKMIRELSEEKYIIKETTLYSAYRITEEGRRYYEEKCLEWQVTKEVVERFIRKKEL